MSEKTGKLQSKPPRAMQSENTPPQHELDIQEPFPADVRLLLAESHPATPKQRLRDAMGHLSKLNERYMLAGGLLIIRSKQDHTS